MTGNGKLLEKTMDIDSKKTHLTFFDRGSSEELQNERDSLVN